MSKLLVLGAVLVLLDVFPGGCSCAPSTVAGPCQSSCDCDRALAAPIKCPGQWACNPKKRCEYSCADLCQDDGGCASTEQVCTGSICAAPLQCP